MLGPNVCISMNIAENYKPTSQSEDVICNEVSTV